MGGDGQPAAHFWDVHGSNRVNLRSTQARCGRQASARSGALFLPALCVAPSALRPTLTSGGASSLANAAAVFCFCPALAVGRSLRLRRPRRRLSDFNVGRLLAACPVSDFFGVPWPHCRGFWRPPHRQTWVHARSWRHSGGHGHPIQAVLRGVCPLFVDSSP